MMGRFRKRPIEVQAYRTWKPVVIHTLEGTLTAEPGDWIVTGIEGESYPCRDSIFRETYEPIDDIARQIWADNEAQDPPVGAIATSD